ncbi:ferric-chelate reductase Frp1 [Exophiala xenobiotica]|nr:ferric-chelate reductase Frp1 [Exophiala xenobiotica]
MDMSGMSGMGGMDMSSASMFTPTNKHIAHVYWYLVAAVTGLLILRRGIDRSRILAARRNQWQPGTIPFRPDNVFAQSYDTLITICRELAYPQIWTFTGRISKYFTPPSLGKCLLLSIYWLVILTMLWSNTILTPSSPDYAYKWEIVGFRAAWVSVTQLPLIYILSGKVNIIGILTGISYERLNWLHRWIGRTIFLTVIVHWSFFFREWDIAHFVKLELDMMPMVKYGFGAWATLGWMVLTGFGGFRAASYELWFLQHLAAAIVLLWLVYSHVPSYARYNVWFSIGVVVLDRSLRTLRIIWLNLLPILGSTESGQSRRKLGYEAEVKSLSSGFILVSIHDVRFSWKPGQHIYLSIPRAGIFEAHPFTIANVPKRMTGHDGPDKVELYIRVHSGFTRRLHRRCQGSGGPKYFRSFLSGPWGVPPLIDRLESLILLASGNGSSFTVPIFQQALASVGNHLRQIRFVWIIRHPDQLGWFKAQLLSACRNVQHRNVSVSIHVFITGAGESSLTPLSPREDNALLPRNSHEMEQRMEKVCGTVDTSRSLHGENSIQTISSDEGQDASKELGEAVAVARSSSSFDSADVPAPALGICYGRPELDPLIRPVVENACGETGIFACGGNQFMGSIRNYVARLSDERAVHKGTGAQGLYLFCETYGW